ncbi:hypothetical protein [Evansella halocellulosilytica]|uniref:hypothetical protein n=1 Tax=Evansella halocellulosilytica TaxID=2011013 RepID=UPI000BB81E1C|nr:hypothetical protein [Evansella halocellulosilytica]
MEIIKQLIIADIRKIEDKPFLVAQYIDEDGFLSDSLILPHVTQQGTVENLRGLTEAYPVDVWTSSREIYSICVGALGLNAQIKHDSETSSTKRQINEADEILRSIYHIEQVAGPEELPFWRRWFSVGLRKLLKIIEGEKYENGI